jgi:hypothetical protein
MENTQEKKECSSCKKNPAKFKAKASIVGIFILATSIYGTVEIVKNILNYFTK